MHALGAHQRLDVAVLGKQGHRRDTLAGKHALEILHQRKAGALERQDAGIAALLGALHVALHGSFHRAQQKRRLRLPDHVERATGLVQLLARDAQRTRVQRRQVGIARDDRVAHKDAQRLGGGLQRLAQLVEHPGQGAEILLARRCGGAWKGLGVVNRWHGLVPDGVHAPVLTQS